MIISGFGSGFFFFVRSQRERFIDLFLFIRM